MKASPLAFVVVLLFLALLIPAIGFAFEDATHVDSVEGEPITLEADEPVAVETQHPPETFSTVVTVIHNDDELVEGEDYDWDAENGTVTAIGSNLDNETVLVDYSYDFYTEETQAVMDVIEPIAGPWLVGLVLVVAIAMMWSWLDFGGNFGGGR